MISIYRQAVLKEWQTLATHTTLWRPLIAGSTEAFIKALVLEEPEVFVLPKEIFPGPVARFAVHQKRITKELHFQVCHAVIITERKLHGHPSSNLRRDETKQLTKSAFVS